MQAPRQKFFEILPANINVPFVAQRWKFIWGSLILVLATFAMLAFNQVTRGAPLRWGIDFVGGSSVRLALAEGKEVAPSEISEALVEFGYQGSSAVSVPQADNEVLIRVTDVISIDDATLAKCETAAQDVGAKLLRFNHPEGASKIFLGYDAEPNWLELEKRLSDAGCEGSVDKGFEVKAGEVPVEVALVGIGNQIAAQLDERFGAGTVKHIVSAESVGAKVGDQLKTDGAKSLLYALGFIFLYVMIRFDLRFAPGGIVALAHDALLTVGAFALTWREFNLTGIAAILTIVGYSINDTIVVFDRVRERVALFRDEDIENTTNRALNETLSRTILTSGTTLLTVVATYIMGSGAIEDFAFALIIGIGVGTYSSICIATPVFLWVNRRFYGGTGHLHWQHDGPSGDQPPGSTRPVLAAAAGEVDEHTGRPVGELREHEASLEDAMDEGQEGAAPPGVDGPTPGGRSTRRRRRRPQ